VANKPLNPEVAKRFKEQRDRVHFEAEVEALITHFNIMLENEGIKNLRIPPTADKVYREALKHFCNAGWNVQVVDNQCSIWID